MSLATLQNKAPKEVLSLLSAVSTSLLPNPNVDKLILQKDFEEETIESVIKEIRVRLNIPEDDFSVAAQTKIFDFLSKEISNIALSDTNISKVKERLGYKGELSLEQYKVDFNFQFKVSEVLGEKKSNILDVVRNPDKYIHLESGYSMGMKMGFSIFAKLITPKKEQDKFFQIVFSIRTGITLNITGTIRAYVSELDLSEANTPLDILKAFVSVYGLTFQVDDLITKFAQNETIEMQELLLTQSMKILDGQIGNYYLRSGWYFDSDLVGKNGKKLQKIVLAFAVDITKYVETLKKHNVVISGEDWRFSRIGNFDKSFPDLGGL